MLVSVDEAKSYLRVDSSDDDKLIEGMIKTAENLCRDIARVESVDEEVFKIAILYSVAYLYEHREEADHHALAITLRSLLFGQRKAVF